MAIHLLTIGKLKSKELENLCANYEKRINSPGLIVHEVKASSENPEKEATEAIKKIKDISKNQSFNVLLSEWGKHYESTEFSKWLQEKLESNAQVNFIIAGAQGHHQNLKNFCNTTISLSKLTFPHKIARLILVEQIYRAQTIRQGHPYHN